MLILTTRNHLASIGYRARLGGIGLVLACVFGATERAAAADATSICVPGTSVAISGYDEAAFRAAAAKQGAIKVGVEGREGRMPPEIQAGLYALASAYGGITFAESVLPRGEMAAALNIGIIDVTAYGCDWVLSDPGAFAGRFEGLNGWLIGDGEQSGVAATPSGTEQTVAAPPPPPPREDPPQASAQEAAVFVPPPQALLFSASEGWSTSEDTLYGFPFDYDRGMMFICDSPDRIYLELFVEDQKFIPNNPSAPLEVTFDLELMSNEKQTKATVSGMLGVQQGRLRILAELKDSLFNEFMRVAGDQTGGVNLRAVSLAVDEGGRQWHREQVQAAMSLVFSVEGYPDRTLDESLATFRSFCGRQ